MSIQWFTCPPYRWQLALPPARVTVRMTHVVANAVVMMRHVVLVMVLWLLVLMLLLLGLLNMIRQPLIFPRICLRWVPDHVPSSPPQNA
jgi:hypothetical protein